MKRVALLLLLIAVVVGLAFLSLPDDPGETETLIMLEPIEEDAAHAERRARVEAVEAERAARLEAMRAEYTELERERRRLRMRLRDVSYYLGYAELEPDQKNEILDDLGKANRLLINPPLLGAFRGVEGIQEELARIGRTNARLDEIEEIIKANSDVEWG
jgi:hypothetical protein